MPVDESQRDAWARKQRNNAPGGTAERGLNGGDGGGTSDGMEPRVAKLEAHMENVRAELAKLASVPVDLAIVKTKVEHLPGKGFVVTAAGTSIVTITGLLVLLQHLGVMH